MKKRILLALITANVIVLLAGCMVGPPPETVYVLDNNQPPIPMSAPAGTIVQPPPAAPVAPAPGAVVDTSAPPIVVVPEVPEVYYVQTVPNMFFYGHLWYYYYGGFWYRSNYYRGPWVSIGFSYMPAPFHRIPERHYRNAGPAPRWDRSEGERRGGEPERGGAPRGRR